MNKSLKLAKAIVAKLSEEGYIAYFAGGWVRDYLLGHPSNEIDIATSASPEKIQMLFPKTVPVGIAFGVIIVVLEGECFEVTTFRKDGPYLDGRHPEGINFSTPEHDAQRRDFTINGMFYDPLTEHIFDYVNGKEDLKRKIIRAIGDPEARFREDRLRMMRAVRFAARFGFEIEPKTKEAIYRYASNLLPSVSMERIFQEFVKMSQFPHFDEALLLLHEFGLLSTIFPKLKNLTSLEIKMRTHAYPYFPIDTPTILYLLELFPSMPLQEKIELCRYLKTSNDEIALVEFFENNAHLFNKACKSSDWAHFYAHPSASLFLEIQAAKTPLEKRAAFLEEHAIRKEHLKLHIERICEKKPIIGSLELKKEGILPGKIMGLLLQEAMRLSIDEDLSDAKVVLAKLKQSPLWPN